MPEAQVISKTSSMIDLHSHWLPADLPDRLALRSIAPRAKLEHGQNPRLIRRESEAGAGFVLGPHWFDLQHRLKHLQQHGISHQLLCWPTTFGFDASLGVEEAKELWLYYNDHLARAIRDTPRSYSGLAVLSTADPQWSAQQLQRAHESQGLIGAVLPINAFASLQTVQALRPILREAQRLKSHLYLHTGFAHSSLAGQPVAQTFTDNSALRGALEIQTHFAAAMVTLLFTDLLDEFPDITFQVAMLGGAGVFACLCESASRGRSPVTEDPAVQARLNRLYLDTGAMGSGSAGIAMHSRVVGHGSLVFGSDFAPVDDVGPVIKRVRDSGLSGAELDSVFHGRASELLARHGVLV